ncbi:LppA family lipoprotein [Mycolicibacterium celeriflavum]|uniref:LppA family lipoprotein n=1 Tax=Mycolicibacterium celeriflavum TaxID=1249101 RepID=UPI003CEA9F85
MQRSLSAGIGVVTMGVLLLGTGCDVSDQQPTASPTSAVDARDQLNALPSLEETQAQVQAVIDEIKAAASGQQAGITWQSLHGETRGNCEGPFENTDGKRLFLPDAVASADLSDAQWEVVLATARQSAARLGATDEQVMQDNPGHHDVWFTGPAGLSVKVAYKGNLVISGFTGCRLPQDRRSAT